MTDARARERERWRSMPRERPERIETPGPGQESVWDYPRPPRLERASERIRVELSGKVIADSSAALRVLETSSPPVYYFPPSDVALPHLVPSARTTFCEWKGVARYWTLRVHERVERDAAWSYPSPDEGFEPIADWLAFYPARVDACWVGDDRVSGPPGGFYGGWITPNVVGPFKGAPGSERW